MDYYYFNYKIQVCIKYILNYMTENYKKKWIYMTGILRKYGLLSKLIGEIWNLNNNNNNKKKKKVRCSLEEIHI